MANALPVIVCVTLVALSASPRARLSLSPGAACDLLTDQGLGTRGFREDARDFACRSQRRALSGGGQPRHTLRYRVLGSGGSVDRLSLELQINSTSAMQRAHRQLVDRVRLLFDRALGQALPTEIETAILGAISGSWQVNAQRVTLERITAGTPHYELRLSIEGP
jgi:hypothetical protein